MSKNKPNWLLRGLIGVSVVIHAFIFMHMAGIYNSHALSFIELTLEDISKPFSREIPRPRLRPKHIEKHREVKKIEIKKHIMPRFKPIKVARVDNNISSGIGENISTSDLLDGSGLDLADWDPNAMEGMKEILTRKDYFELVQLRIEGCKKYPDVARQKHMEGHAKVRFVITPNGQVSSVEIVKGSRYEILNMAALNAIKAASPFPRPPANLFKGPLRMEITIMFELT